MKRLYKVNIYQYLCINFSTAPFPPALWSVPINKKRFSGGLEFPQFSVVFRVSKKQKPRMLGLVSALRSVSNQQIKFPGWLKPSRMNTAYVDESKMLIFLKCLFAGRKLFQNDHRAI